MSTTVLIENAILLVCTGYAFNKRRYKTLLLLMLANVMFMLVDNILLNIYDIYTVNYDHTSYYVLLSFFFITMTGLFLHRITGMGLVFAGCMLIQSFSCFLMAINGVQLNGASLPEYDIIYVIHGLINAVVWVVEIFTVLSVEIGTAWIAMTTGHKK